MPSIDRRDFTAIYPVCCMGNYNGIFHSIIHGNMVISGLGIDISIIVVSSDRMWDQIHSADIRLIRGLPGFVVATSIECS